MIIYWENERNRLKKNNNFKNKQSHFFWTIKNKNEMCYSRTMKEQNEKKSISTPLIYLYKKILPRKMYNFYTKNNLTWVWYFYWIILFDNLFILFRLWFITVNNEYWYLTLITYFYYFIFYKCILNLWNF